MNESDLIKRIEGLEKDNATSRKSEKELKNKVKGVNKLIANNKIMVKANIIAEFIRTDVAH